MADLTATESEPVREPTQELLVSIVPSGQPGPRRAGRRWLRLSRRSCLVGGVLVVTAVLVVVGLLLSDQIHQRQQFDRTRASLNLTRQHVASVSGQLSAVRRQLHLVSTQVGNDTTAAAQDASELKGAQSALTAAEAHVTQQASLIGSLQTCLGGVERALNALAVGKIDRAASALDAVPSGCTAAEAASG
jgi:hypothetical protein